MPDGSGVRFSGRGIVYSGPLSVDGRLLTEPASLSIELAVRPDRDWRKYIPVIVAIDDGKSCERLIIGQWKAHLIVRSRQGKACQQAGMREIGVQYALPKGKESFISITSGIGGTAVYVDGQLKERRKTLSFPRFDGPLSGRLVLGNSAEGKDSWTGTVSRLAVYNQELSQEETLRRYEAWRNNTVVAADNNTAPAALYLFDEGAGPHIRDHSGLGNDLIIPERFIPLRRSVLSPPRRDSYMSRAYVRDIALNILGFIPFGFFISWYLSERGASRLRVIVIVMLLGAGTSLFIECIQAYLPERTSQLSDLMTNSSGTAIGIYLWRRFILPFRTDTH
jgi:hypothetical protein